MSTLELVTFNNVVNLENIRQRRSNVVFSTSIFTALDNAETMLWIMLIKRKFEINKKQKINLDSNAKQYFWALNKNYVNWIDWTYFIFFSPILGEVCKIRIAKNLKTIIYRITKAVFKPRYFLNSWLVFNFKRNLAQSQYD